MEQQANPSQIELMMIAVVETVVEGVHAAVLVEFVGAAANQTVPAAVVAPWLQRFVADRQQQNGRCYVCP